MSKKQFHYIWMGRLPDVDHMDAFAKGPNDLAHKARLYHNTHKSYFSNFWKSIISTSQEPIQITMWVPEDLIDQIIELHLLDDNIQLKAIENAMQQSTNFSAQQMSDLETTLDLLGKYNAYSSQKDILSAFIMEEYGGYYLDTTTNIVSIERFIESHPKDIWFPRVSKHEAIIFNGESVILPDVWALYNPKSGTGIFRKFIESFVKRCQFYFPTAYDQADKHCQPESNIPGEFKSGYVVLGEDSFAKGDEIMLMPRHRDNLIGQTVIFSLLEAIKLAKGTLDNSTIKQISSFAGPAPFGKKIDDFLLDKFHMGLWRSQSLAERFQSQNEQFYKLELHNNVISKHIIGKKTETQESVMHQDRFFTQNTPDKNLEDKADINNEPDKFKEL